ncbi:MAG: ribose 5-phosphate isomerase B [Elusimicrobiota bacterium]
MKIVIGTDHRGVAVKNELRKYLSTKGFDVTDAGTNSVESCDYPDYAFVVAEHVSKKLADRGVLVCGSGIGMSIAANKVDGIRAALCLTPLAAQRSVEHNNANVLVVSADFTSIEDMKKIVDTWFTAGFTGGRHERRINKIAEYEQQRCKKLK